MFRNRWFFSNICSFYTVPQGFIAPFPSYSIQCHFLIQLSTFNITLNEWMPNLALKLHFHSPTPKVFKCAEFTPACSSTPLGRGLGYSFLWINHPSRFSCSRFFFKDKEMIMSELLSLENVPLNLPHLFLSYLSLPSGKSPVWSLYFSFFFCLLICFLDSTRMWNHMAFVLLSWIYFP